MIVHFPEPVVKRVGKSELSLCMMKRPVERRIPCNNVQKRDTSMFFVAVFSFSFVVRAFVVCLDVVLAAPRLAPAA